MSAVAEPQMDLSDYALQLGRRAQQASRVLAQATSADKNRWLKTIARLLREQSADLLAANQLDVEAAPQMGLSSAAIDRLRLTTARIESLASAVEEIIGLPDPVGEVLDGQTRPNGLQVQRVRVPLGVVFFIFESRPNVTVDAAALCIKSGNAVILRGGKEALNSNLALYRLLQQGLRDCGLPAEGVQLVETTDRAAVGHFLQLNQYITVTIPRGGKSLIERVVSEARMPVIKHYDGLCHVYIDQSADWEQARDIVVNAKCQRPGVCNAAECVLVHKEWAERYLADLAAALQKQGVELRGCAETCRLVPETRPATEEDYRTEYLDLILSAKVVPDFSAAVEHIADFGSHHTDAIVTRDYASAERFIAAVDSAAVVVNASTRFNDGGELGLGAEIGISTDKLHARGPCGLRELTSYKYVVRGQGQIRT